MLNLIKRNYWWPEIKTDIKKYIQEYQKSQQNKNAIYEKDRGTTFIGNTSRTIVRNQYQHYWTTIKIKRQGYYSGNCRSIYKYDSTQGNNNGGIIGRNS